METTENIEFKTVEEKNISPHKKNKLPVVLVAAAILGIGTGALIFGKKGTLSLSQTPKTIQTDKIVGSTASNFDKEAEGVLQKNDGKLVKDGTHVLIRGDVSQNVYLTSSVIDLDGYVGQKVRVWGQTLQSKTAGWFMDVGKLEKLQ